VQIHRGKLMSNQFVRVAGVLCFGLLVACCADLYAPALHAQNEQARQAVKLVRSVCRQSGEVAGTLIFRGVNRFAGRVSSTETCPPPAHVGGSPGRSLILGRAEYMHRGAAGRDSWSESRRFWLHHDRGSRPACGCDRRFSENK
jgi:hypothetical protein